MKPGVPRTEVDAPVSSIRLLRPMSQTLTHQLFGGLDLIKMFWAAHQQCATGGV